MKKLLHYIITSIVDNPDQVVINQSIDETGLVQFDVTVAQNDMGKVIGKEGRVINSIRKIIKIASIRQGKRVNISIDSPKA